jgi:amino acid adenylation domain-containing protein
LDLFSDSLAYKLQCVEVKPGDACIVWWPRSIELHVAILAILKCGATYVPIDFEMPEERVAAVLKDINAKVLITPNSFTEAFNIVNEIVFKKEDAALYKPVQMKPEDDAYILFTSGSTGKPKGIPITQKNVCSFIRSENDLIEIKNTDKVYQGISVSFDMWCEETWISYLVGATLWIADVITSKSIDELSNVLGKEQITVLHTVPSLLAVMEDADLPLLRLINAGGEACTPQVLNKWAVGNRLFFNSYGPTETTVTASATLLKKGDKITIGKPLANYALAVVNEAMQPLPIGEQGELVVSGSGVGRGYINLEKLTKEKFVPKNTALAKMPGEIIYRTGDAVYMDENLDVHFVGRIDDQIKLRGYRIELGEIETLLNEYTGVQQAAVALKKDSNNQDQLTGYVVMQKNMLFDETMIKEKLSQKLPDYMIPLAIVPLYELPRLPSGKIDRKKLPVPESFLKQISSAQTTINANDTTEQKVIKLLSEVFAKKDIIISQDFFNDLGGHSLLAASFVSKIRKEGNIKNASLKDIYLNRPLSALINKWDKTELAEDKKIKEPFKKIPVLRYYICGLAQSISLLFIYGLLALQIFIPYLSYYFMQLEYDNYLKSILISILTFCMLPPLFTGIGIGAKWMIIGTLGDLFF